MLNVSRLTAAASLAACVTFAQATPESRPWPATIAAAKGQTVYWNAWGGDDRTNAFIAWAGGEVKRRYGITIEQVKLDSNIGLQAAPVKAFEGGAGYSFPFLFPGNRSASVNAGRAADSAIKQY